MSILAFIAVVLGEIAFVFSVALIASSMDVLSRSKVEAAKAQWPGVVIDGKNKETRP